MVLELANRITIEPADVVSVLDLQIVEVQQVTEFRCEYQLGSSYLWADATAVVGGKNNTWRVIDLVPRELSLAAFRLDPPHEVRPHLKYTADGPTVAALEYRFAVRAGELAIRTVGQTMRIERITLTSRHSPASS